MMLKWLFAVVVLYGGAALRGAALASILPRARAHDPVSGRPVRGGGGSTARALGNAYTHRCLPNERKAYLVKRVALWQLVRPYR